VLGIISTFARLGADPSMLEWCLASIAYGVMSAAVAWLYRPAPLRWSPRRARQPTAATTLSFDGHRLVCGDHTIDLEAPFQTRLYRQGEDSWLGLEVVPDRHTGGSPLRLRVAVEPNEVYRELARLDVQAPVVDGASGARLLALLRERSAAQGQMLPWDLVSTIEERPARPQKREEVVHDEVQATVKARW
ncbi:MAG: hypothetical protein AAFS10_09145, partial [Myxococcota bacterium]